MKKEKKATKKDKRRIFILVLILIPLFTVFIANMFGYWSQIYNNIKEKKELEDKYALELEEEQKLNSEINKLQDAEYIARYAREKYLYSKEGEIIIKID